MGIKHRADSAFRKFSALIQVRFGRTVECFEMPYVSYPRPLPVMRKESTIVSIYLNFIHYFCWDISTNKLNETKI